VQQVGKEITVRRTDTNPEGDTSWNFPLRFECCTESTQSSTTSEKRLGETSAERLGETSAERLHAQESESLRAEEADKFLLAGLKRVVDTAKNMANRVGGDAIKKAKGFAITKALDLVLPRLKIAWMKAPLTSLLVDQNIGVAVQQAIRSKEMKAFTREHILLPLLKSIFGINRGAWACTTNQYLKATQVQTYVQLIPEEHREESNNHFAVSLSTKDSDGKMACKSEFRYDYLFCTEWRTDEACQGAWVHRPSEHKLVHSTKGQNCEPWFSMLDGFMRSFVGLYTSIFTAAVFSTAMGPNGRNCLHHPKDMGKDTWEKISARRTADPAEKGCSYLKQTPLEWAAPGA